MGYADKDIHNLRFDIVKSAAEAEEMFTRLRLKSSWSWIGPQLMAHLATYKINRNKEGKIDGQVFLEENIKGRAWDTGIYRTIVLVERSKLMSKMTERQNLKFCSLVPIYMAAQKDAKGIKYSEWTNIKNIVPARLAEAMLSPKPEWNTTDEDVRDALLRLRIEGLHGKSPQTSYAMKNLEGTLLGPYNVLARAMLTQIWCAHPSNRDPLMVLDPWDWDRMPEPLIPGELFSDDLPWND